MNCPEFQNLLPLEKTEYIGQLIHAAMSDSKFYLIGEKIIKQAKIKGLLAGVAIHPPDWSNVPPPGIETEQNTIDNPDK